MKKADVLFSKKTLQAGKSITYRLGTSPNRARLAYRAERSTSLTVSPPCLTTPAPTALEGSALAHRRSFTGGPALAHPHRWQPVRAATWEELMGMGARG